jgi:hypothetical protein
MATAAQVKANQQNSQKSTGAVTAEGKQTVSKNAIKYGILTNRLLDHESPDEYRALLDGLLLELNPVGSLESALVEKVAIILWRQKRLVQAETAEISLQQTTKKLLGAVSDAIGLGYGDAITESDLTKADTEQLQWCMDVIEEIQNCTDWADMKTNAPLCWGQVVDEAEREDQKPDEYLRYLVANDLSDWLSDLRTWCRNQLKKVANAEKAKQLIPTVTDKLSVMKSPDQFLKYQGSLDNQLYKALKALREQQQYRLQSIDSETIETVN